MADMTQTQGQNTQNCRDRWAKHKVSQVYVCTCSGYFNYSSRFQNYHKMKNVLQPTTKTFEEISNVQGLPGDWESFSIWY